ncbi:RDD family protein [Petropleomorpha daqingensis]|uniref:Putative RDD family membrane protein YckC n=1 Tax=Petropleomorpha daqingensis TaxID=2026353 RepID=A0A853CNN8_9ACTN|nr:RDD family protein [Petropleomorpha daqingensis]NYJ07593.1 putative RDD family membrane protein YckC [Petropleomorpha daqingensis]
MVRDAEQPSQGRVRGAALGLPAEGPGSLASFSTRVTAYVIDAIAAAFIAGLFTAPKLPGLWSLVSFAAITIGSLLAFGQTPGMRVCGLRLAHPVEGRRLAPWRAVVRTALLMLLVPALLVDADGRGLHDRATQTAVVRER